MQAAEEAQSAATLRVIANCGFCVVRERDVFFNVIRHMRHRRAEIAVVVNDRGGLRASNVAGLITKEQVADSVASSILVFPMRT